jgi:hypothetical protein
MKWRKCMVHSGCRPIKAGCVRPIPETCMPFRSPRQDATDITVCGRAFGWQICFCNILASSILRTSPRAEAEHQGDADMYESEHQGLTPRDS